MSKQELRVKYASIVNEVNELEKQRDIILHSEEMIQGYEYPEQIADLAKNTSRLNELRKMRVSVSDQMYNA